MGLLLALALLAAAPAQLPEKELLYNSPEFGNFHKSKDVKEKGKRSLKVWENYAEFQKKQPSRYKSMMLQGPGALEVSYDEIWEQERDYDPTLVVPRERRGEPFRVKLYWLQDQAQAFVVEKYCQTDPLTWEKLDKPGYRLIALVDRKSMLPILAKLEAKEKAFFALPPGAHLQEAQKALAAGNPNAKDIKNRTYGRLEDARRHLEAIQLQVKKLDEESKKLLQEVENREKDLKKYKEVMQKAARERTIKKREEVAKSLDRDFLSKGFDVKIQLNGSEKTTIKMESPVFNRPMVFALIDKSPMLQNLRDAGFEEVVFSNRSIKFNWEIDLNS
jgi:DNA-binding protein H-NS